jgi:hypothetical protein
LSNEAYAATHRAVSRHLEPADREDIISEMVLSMLSGELALEDATDRSDEFTSRFLRPQKRFLYSSLDLRLSDDGPDSQAVDILTTDDVEMFL